MTPSQTVGTRRIRLELDGWALAAHYFSPALLLVLAAAGAGWNREGDALIAHPWAAGTFLVVGLMAWAVQWRALDFTPIRTARSDARNREIVEFMARRFGWAQLQGIADGELRFRASGQGRRTLVTVRFDATQVYICAIEQSRGRFGTGAQARKQVAEALAVFN